MAEKMKREIHKLTDNGIPKDIHRKAEMLARAIFNTKPIANDELRINTTGKVN